MWERSTFCCDFALMQPTQQESDAVMHRWMCCSKRMKRDVWVCSKQQAQPVLVGKRNGHTTVLRTLPVHRCTYVADENNNIHVGEKRRREPDLLPSSHDALRSYLEAEHGKGDDEVQEIKGMGDDEIHSETLSIADLDDVADDDYFTPETPPSSDDERGCD